MADTVKRSGLPALLVDTAAPTAEHADRPFRFTGGAMSYLLPFLLGTALLVISAVGWMVDAHQFYFSYLVGWVFCLTIAIGALFFLFFQHLTRAYWVVAVRRLPEVLAYSFPLLAVLFIPIIFGMHDLYHWTHEELYDPASPEYDEILAGKRVYLNTPFFLIRIVFYFAVWIYIAYRLYTLSVRQDVEEDREIPVAQRRVSAWGLPLTAVTTAFASYDLLMSLDPHWFSTIFGVYFFAGSIQAVLCVIALSGILLQRSGMLQQTITKEHYQDLGKLMFGFVVFWAYIAFSQYMLIWYGGIPEETVWYRHRIEHGWGYHSAALLGLNFILPFLILLPRATKRSIPLMSIMTIWLLIMHWFDLHWLSMPVLHADHAGFHWLDFACWLGLVLVFVSAYLWRLSRHPLVPQRDPRLAKSLRFENT